MNVMAASCIIGERNLRASVRNLILEHILGDISLFYGGKLAKESNTTGQGRECYS